MSFETTLPPPFWGTVGLETEDSKLILRGGLMSKWQCQVCGYIYDPQNGDPESGVAPGTPFEKLPNEWVCPECGAGKDQFEKI